MTSWEVSLTIIVRGYDEGLGYTFGETHNPAIKGLIQGKSANENITWEVARKYNLGLETKWLKDKISASIDFLKNVVVISYVNRKDILKQPVQTDWLP